MYPHPRIEEYRRAMAPVIGKALAETLDTIVPAPAGAEPPALPDETGERSMQVPERERQREDR